MLLGTYVFLGVSYVLLAGVRLWPGSYLLKPVPVLILAYLVFTRRPAGERLGRYIGIGFVFSGLGDLLLALDSKGLFLHALAAFLLTHLCYIRAFLSVARFDRKRLRLVAPVLGLAIAAAGAALAFAGGLRVAVLLYVAAIAAMAALASFVPAKVSDFWLGAVLFLAADALLGVHRFIVEIPQAVSIVMALYLTGQYRIARGTLDRARER